MVSPLEQSALALGAQETRGMTSPMRNGTSANGRVKRWGSSLQATVTTPLQHLLFDLGESQKLRDVHGVTFKNGPSPADWPTASFVSSVTSQESTICILSSPSEERTIKPYHGVSCGKCGSIVTGVVNLSQSMKPSPQPTMSLST